MSKPDIKDFSSKEIKQFHAYIQNGEWDQLAAELFVGDEINNHVANLIFDNSKIAQKMPLSFVEELFDFGYIPESEALGSLVNLACFYGNLDLFKYLVEERAINVPDVTLLQAPLSGNLDIVKYIIDEMGYPPECQVFKPLTVCLEYADENENYVEIINYIIENYDINYDTLPRVTACYIKNFETFKKFIDHKQIKEVNTVFNTVGNNQKPWSLLMNHIRYNNVDNVKYLLDHGAKLIHETRFPRGGYEEQDLAKEFAGKEIQGLINTAAKEHRIADKTSPHMLDDMAVPSAIPEAMAFGYFEFALMRVIREKRPFRKSDFKLRHVDGTFSNVGRILSLRGDLHKVFNAKAWAHVRPKEAMERLNDIYEILPSISKKRMQEQYESLLSHLNDLHKAEKIIDATYQNAARPNLKRRRPKL